MNQRDKDDLREGYPAELIRSGVRGKYAKCYREGSNVVVIDPDLAKVFPNTDAVNDALRDYLAKREANATQQAHAVRALRAPAAGAKRYVSRKK